MSTFAPFLPAREAIGPILMGMRKRVHLLQIGDFNEIDVVNMTAIAVVDAQAGERFGLGA